MARNQKIKISETSSPSSLEARQIAYNPNTNRLHIGLGGGNYFSLYIPDTSDFITEDDLASASVNYATTAGSAKASDVYAWAKKSSLAASDVPDLSGTYLPLSGGTLTSTSVPLTINRIWGGYSTISYLIDGVQKGLLGFDVNGNLIVSPNRETSSTYYDVIHSGNIGSQSVNYATSAGEIINSSTWIVAPLSSGTGAQVQGSLTVRPSGSSSGVNFNVDGNGNVTATGDFTAFTASDKALKDNITPIAAKDALKVIKSLNPVTFDWNDTATSLSERLKGHSQGFIAQDYEKIIPNSSHLMWGEYKGIDYIQSIPYIVAVEQNHESRLEKLEKKVKELEKRLAKYESID